MKILITGFEPFGGERLNPSLEVMRRLPDRLGRASLIKLELPTTFAGCWPPLEEALRAHRPEAVVCLGQAGGDAALSVERVAINLDDARIADNAGAQPVDQPILPQGPAACFSTLPVRQIVDAMKRAGVPAQLSYSAGTYACNHVMYRLLHWQGQHMPAARGGFIHLPLLPEQAAARPSPGPSMALNVMLSGLTAALSVLEAG